MPLGTQQQELPHQDEDVNSSLDPQMPPSLLSPPSQQILSNLFLLPDLEGLTENLNKPKGVCGLLSAFTFPPTHSLFSSEYYVISVLGKKPFCVNGNVKFVGAIK